MRIRYEKIGDYQIELFEDERNEFDFAVCLNTATAFTGEKDKAETFYEGMRTAAILKTDSKDCFEDWYRGIVRILMLG